MKHVLTALVALSMLAAACGPETDPAVSGDEGLTVVAAIYPLFEVAQAVAGKGAELVNLTPPGAEAHDLELTPRQVGVVESAEVVLVLGRGFQPAVERVAGGSGGVTVVLLDALGETEGEIDPHDHAGEDDHATDDHAGENDDEGDNESDDHGHEDETDDVTALDPHVWLDPVLMLEVVDAVRDAFVEADPARAAEYERNAEIYAAQVDALHHRYEESLARCERRLIVTAHEAFGRLAARYGLEQEGIAGISPDQEPDPRRLAELTELVRDEGATTVFTETLVSPAIADTLAREAGVETAVLNPLEGLTEDEQAAGETYLSVMENNLDELVAALGCDAP